MHTQDVRSEESKKYQKDLSNFCNGPSINVGGGRKFSFPGWINLDAATGFALTPTCVFPVADRSAPFVYSSHCLEHLDDATVDRVLDESRRVCGDRLVLKLPDFEDVIKRKSVGDHGYFRQWGMDGLTSMWEKDSIDLRASMIFCGYWNEAYGHEFVGRRSPDAPGAYHGPAGVPDWTSSPHEIAATLRAMSPKGAVFNHQNAWSRRELIDLLEKHGFEVLSMDAEKILKLPIPTLEKQREISMYVLAR